MENIAEKIVRAENDLLELKTEQRTRNDSFEFYAFQTENLWGKYGDYHNFTIRFIPNQKKEKDVICRFYGECGVMVQYHSPIYIELSDQLKATYTSGYASSYESAPAFLKFEYIGCYANCDGQLVIE